MKHELDENGICWKVRTVKGDDAWILCGRASYEAVTRCDEHNEPLKAATARPAPAGEGEECFHCGGDGHEVDGTECRACFGIGRILASTEEAR